MSDTRGPDDEATPAVSLGLPSQGQQKILCDCSLDSAELAAGRFPYDWSEEGRLPKRAPDEPLGTA